MYSNLMLLRLIIYYGRGMPVNNRRKLLLYARGFLQLGDNYWNGCPTRRVKRGHGMHVSMLSYIAGRRPIREGPAFYIEAYADAPVGRYPLGWGLRLSVFACGYFDTVGSYQVGYTPWAKDCPNKIKQLSKGGIYMLLFIVVCLIGLYMIVRD
jgi:hypothetical protein